MNDLSRDTCPAQQVKCVVIDEAHKALGNHAYSQVQKTSSSQQCHKDHLHAVYGAHFQGARDMKMLYSLNALQMERW